jgi:hypothetical protein
MQILSGSIYRLERDDDAQTWLVIEDDSAIQRFGFTRADFPDATPPALPEWVAPPDPREQMSCSKLQAKLAIAQLGMVADFLALRASLDPVADFVKLAFIDDAQVWKRTDPTFNAITDSLGKSEAEKDAFFMLASTL